MRSRSLGFVLFAVAVIAPPAVASYAVVTGAVSPQLRIDAAGNAEVGWSAGGARKTFVVPRHGLGHYGTVDRDASKPAGVSLPMAVVVRETPDHTQWALQQVAISGRPTSLDLARWQGAPTKLMLVDDGTHLTGSATFHGRPVTGYSSTLTGKRSRIYVYLECFGCPARRGGWSLLLGVPPKANGAFSVALRPNWTGRRYRATLFGPNVAGQLAPDARVTLDAP
jgi:hypothetical protein